MCFVALCANTNEVLYIRKLINSGGSCRRHLEGNALTNIEI